MFAGSLALLVCACGSSDATSAAGSTAGASGATGGSSGAGGASGSGGGSSGSSGSAGSAGAAPDPCPRYVGTPASGQALCAWLLGKRAGNGVGQDPMALTVPAGQTLLTAGFFVGSIDFGAGPIDDKPASAASSGGSAFFTEIGATGRSTLAKTFGTSGVQTFNGVASDASGAIVLVGSNFGEVDFGGGALSASPSATVPDGVIVKLDGSQKHVFSRDFVANFAGVGIDAAGHVHSAGNFIAPLSLGGAMLANPGPSSAIFALELDAAGAHVYSASFVASNGASALAFASDAAGDVAIVGTYNGTIDFGGGHTLTSTPTGAFLLVLDAAHGFVFARSLGSMDGQGAAVTFDSAGNLIVAGNEHDDTDFGGGTLVNAGGADLFIAKYGPTGNYLDSKVFGDAADQRGRSVAVDAAGHLLVSGKFAGTMSFAGSDLTAQGDNDLFLLAFNADLSPRFQHAFSNDFSPASQALTTFDADGNAWLVGSVVGLAPDFGTGPLTSEMLDRRAFFAKFAL